MNMLNSLASTATTYMSILDAFNKIKEDKWNSLRQKKYGDKPTSEEDHLGWVVSIVLGELVEFLQDPKKKNMLVGILAGVYAQNLFSESDISFSECMDRGRAEARAFLSEGNLDTLAWRFMSHYREIEAIWKPMIGEHAYGMRVMASAITNTVSLLS